MIVPSHGSSQVDLRTRRPTPSTFLPSTGFSRSLQLSDMVTTREPPHPSTSSPSFLSSLVSLSSRSLWVLLIVFSTHRIISMI